MTREWGRERERKSEREPPGPGLELHAVGSVRVQHPETPRHLLALLLAIFLMSISLNALIEVFSIFHLDYCP